MTEGNKQRPGILGGDRPDGIPPGGAELRRGNQCCGSAGAPGSEQGNQFGGDVTTGNGPCRRRQEIDRHIPHQLGNPGKRALDKIGADLFSPREQFDQLTPLHRPSARIGSGLAKNSCQAVVITQVGRAFMGGRSEMVKWPAVNGEGSPMALSIP